MAQATSIEPGARFAAKRTEVIVTEVEDGEVTYRSRRRWRDCYYYYGSMPIEHFRAELEKNEVWNPGWFERAILTGIGAVRQYARILRYHVIRFLQDRWSRTIGLKLAVWYSDRHPECCWADICTDMGMGHNLFRNYKRTSYACGTRLSTDADRENPNALTCWCGKQVEEVTA